LSDLHLESQGFEGPLPTGDVLIIAGDLCHARCLDPARADRYSVDQRARTLRFIDTAVARFARVLLVAGNHDHYDGVFEETVDTLRRFLPGVTVLDNEVVEIDGIRFFGGTLWSNFSGGSKGALDDVRRRMGEYFFVERRRRDVAGRDMLARFQPEDALEAFGACWKALQRCIGDGGGKTTIIVTHHAPSRQGLNPRHAGGALDAAYASDLDTVIAGLSRVPVWVHGHTHIDRTYPIGDTVVRANCRGFDGRDATASTFSANRHFDL
jgi:Icc-related predicted phosphoesterase